MVSQRRIIRRVTQENPTRGTRGALLRAPGRVLGERQPTLIVGAYAREIILEGRHSAHPTDEVRERDCGPATSLNNAITGEQELEHSAASELISPEVFRDLTD